MKRRRPLLPAVTLGVLCTLASFGCKKKEPTGDELLATHRAAIEPRAANYEKIAKAALPAATGRIKLAGPPMHMLSPISTPKNGNAVFGFAEDLKDLSTFGDVNLRTSDNMELANHCFMLVRKHSLAGMYSKTSKSPPEWPEWNQLIITNAIESCALLRYVVIVKMSSYKASEYVDKKTYVGGSVKGDLLVFDLDTGAFAGGVPFDAESSDFTKSDHAADLSNNFYAAIRGALQKALPDAKGL